MMADSQNARTEDKTPSEAVPAQPAGNNASNPLVGTAEQKTSLANGDERRTRIPVRFRKLRGKPGKAVVDQDDPSYPAKLQEAFGTADAQLQTYVLNQAAPAVVNAILRSSLRADAAVEAANALASIMTEIKPRDALEGLLAAQIVVFNALLMNAAQRATLPDQTLATRQVYMNCVVKLSRAFTAHMEALKKYRAGGVQKMMVEHVHVNEGGQAAFVGNVQASGEAGRDNQP